MALPAADTMRSVEGAVGSDEVLYGARLAGGSHRREHPTEVVQDLLAVWPHAARGPLLDDRAGLDDILGLLRRDRDDHGALLGIEPDQTLDLEA